MKSGVQWDLLTSPEWFIYAAGDSALHVTGAVASIPTGVLQQRPCILLWFHREDAYVECDAPLPETTMWFADWWRSLQRGLLSPSVESAVHLLIRSRQESCDEATEPCSTQCCLCLVVESDAAWRAHWSQRPLATASTPAFVTTFSAHEEVADSACQCLSALADADESSAPQKQPSLADPIFSENVFELIALEPSAESSTKHRYLWSR
ncbi:uncharacterized protein Tco025E_06755 [Trypanosoma conorhini]|uniref:Uncharacterized protein n=1 Tax=Trypanosoma conorhini TaxID=83891 RepID=A0A3R7KVR3_9TRYP|nr:uncharacterized protein Tco025E_06755 [Trypanosoma conorhini]RNF10675.1 hypothetical protein Tco025E_06755 [Trypanosoma conorhini]